MADMTKIKNLTINTAEGSYQIDSQDVYEEMGVSEQRFAELLGRDFYCPVLATAPDSTTLTYTDTDGSTNHFAVGQEAIVGDKVYKFMGLTADGKAKWRDFTPVTFTGNFQTSNAPYVSNSLTVMSTGVYLSKEETDEAPVSLYTDNEGNRLLYNDTGYVISDESTTQSWLKIH